MTISPFEFYPNKDLFLFRSSRASLCQKINGMKTKQIEAEKHWNRSNDLINQKKLQHVTGWFQWTSRKIICNRNELPKKKSSLQTPLVHLNGTFNPLFKWIKDSQHKALYARGAHSSLTKIIHLAGSTIDGRCSKEHGTKKKKKLKCPQYGKRATHGNVGELIPANSSAWLCPDLVQSLRPVRLGLVRSSRPILLSRQVQNDSTHA